MIKKNKLFIVVVLTVGLCQAAALKELYNQVSEKLVASKQQLDSAQPKEGTAVDIEPIKQVINSLCTIVPATLISNAKGAIQALEEAQAQATGKAGTTMADLEQKKETLEAEFKTKEVELRNAILGNITTAVKQLIEEIKKKLDAIAAATVQKALVENRDRYVSYVDTILGVLNEIKKAMKTDDTKEINQLITDIKGQKDVLVNIKLATQANAKSVKNQFDAILKYFEYTVPRTTVANP